MNEADSVDLTTAMLRVMEIVNNQNSHKAQVEAMSIINRTMIENIKPVVVHQVKQSKCTTIRLLSFNVDMSFDKKFVSAKIAQFCNLIHEKQINMFCLQEIHTKHKFGSDNVSDPFCDKIINGLSADWRYVFDVCGIGKYNQTEASAIFYNLEYFDVAQVYKSLSDPFEFTRTVQCVRFCFKCNGCMVIIYNFHLAGGTNKESIVKMQFEIEELKSVIEYASVEYEHFSLLVGDFNCDLSTKNYLGGRVLSSRFPTLHSNKAGRKVDFVVMSVPSPLCQYDNEQRSWKFICDSREIVVEESERKLAGGQHLSNHCPIAFEIDPISVISSDICPERD